MLLLLVPFRVKANTYNTLNFKETLAAEEIKEEFTKYKESNNQITIYLFRGQGCGYCRAYLTFMNSITEEYGKYFKMVTYEVWNDEKNSELFSQISSFLEKPAGGVPYIIIGDKVFAGYSSEYDEDIKTAIVDLYNTKPKKRYDVMKEYEKSKKQLSNTSLFILNLLFVLIATCGTLYYVNTKLKEINSKIENLVVKESKKEKSNNKKKE